MTTTLPAADTVSPNKTSTVLLAGLVAAVAALVANTVVAQIALAAGSSEDFTAFTNQLTGQ